MADILIDNESVPATPASGKSVIFVDSVTKKPVLLDDGGSVIGVPLSRNFSTASQGAGFATDTYVTNSGLQIPSCSLQAGMTFRWTITASKTAASTATPIYTIRLGAGQSTSDTSILALTGAAQTAAADNGILIITATLRNTGASGVLAGAAGWAKTQAGTAGFGGSIDGVSSGFVTTGTSSQYMGLSINGGASAAWTITSVHAQALT